MVDLDAASCCMRNALRGKGGEILVIDPVQACSKSTGCDSGNDEGKRRKPAQKSDAFLGKKESTLLQMARVGEWLYLVYRLLCCWKLF